MPQISVSWVRLNIIHPQFQWTITVFLAKIAKKNAGRPHFQPYLFGFWSQTYRCEAQLSTLPGVIPFWSPSLDTVPCRLRSLRSKAQNVSKCAIPKDKHQPSTCMSMDTIFWTVNLCDSEHLGTFQSQGSSPANQHQP